MIVAAEMTATAAMTVIVVTETETMIVATVIVTTEVLSSVFVVVTGGGTHCCPSCKDLVTMAVMIGGAGTARGTATEQRDRDRN